MVSLRSSLSSAALGPAFLTSTLRVGDALAAAVESWIGRLRRMAHDRAERRAQHGLNRRVEQSFADLCNRWCSWRRVRGDQQTDLIG